MPQIRKGKKGGEDGGGPAPSGDGGNVHYPKNDGTSDDKVGGVPTVETNHKGLNLELGK